MNARKCFLPAGALFFSLYFFLGMTTTALIDIYYKHTHTHPHTHTHTHTHTPSACALFSDDNNGRLTF
jgi:hypothetical protein